jgi:signal transduction histidine kinase
VKKKLKFVFILIALSLLGIIIFQSYWTINAYKVNKDKFDTNVNIAMQNAMDDCKKDYFDSIRRVLIKRLSPPETIIKVDTLPHFGISDPKGFFATYDILFLHRNTLPPEPFTTTKTKLDFYRKKINHKATLPEVLVEMSFYEPSLMQKISSLLYSFDSGTTLFTMEDIKNTPTLFKSAKFKGLPILGFFIKYTSHDSLNRQPGFYKHARDSAIEAYLHSKDTFDPAQPGKISAKNPIMLMQLLSVKPTQKKHKIASAKHRNSHIAQTQIVKLREPDILIYPPDYRQADSIKLSGYFDRELQKLNISSSFKLVISLKSTEASKINTHYAETNEYDYKYQGFKVFGYGDGEFFIRAKFLTPQYGVLKSMLLTLLLSLFLVLFIIFCFNYIVRTFIEQRKLGELKDDFISNMTHELKTPIATITVAIEGLQSFNALDDVEKTQRYLQTSRNELERLNNLVTKVLDIAAFENKEVKLVKEHININDLVNDVIASEKSKTIKKVKVSFVNTNNSETIYADKFHFRNVLINLVDNAVKYSNEPITIVISCYKDAFHLNIFSVKDNGIGIPSAHTGLVFDKFHRVPTGNVHAVKGTGLGLSYVKYIVDAHGGSITVKSELNKGSEFIVSIP